MRNLLFLLIIFTLISCGRTPIPKDTTISAPPQYLEIARPSDNSEDEVNKDLHYLQLAEPPVYRIGPGDRFNIFVAEEIELSLVDVPVKKDGTLSFKLIGEQKIGGLTLAQAIANVNNSYRKYIKDPDVSIVPIRLKSTSVTILGKVRVPGVYEIIGKKRILDAIALAGGLDVGLFEGTTIELANLERSYIVRDGRILPIDFQKLIRGGDMLQNIPLMNNDYIFIPSAMNKEVYVIGNVKAPGHFLFKEKMSLLMAVAFAGGRSSFACSQAIILRGKLTHPRVFTINMDEVIRGKYRDFALQPDDIIYIPQSFVGDFTEVMSVVLPTLNSIQSGWVVKQIFEDANK